MSLRFNEMENKIIEGGCLEVMKEIPDKTIDLVLTDPPYGTKEMSHRKNSSRGKLALTKDYGSQEWDNEIPKKQIFDEMLRISKNQVIFGGNYFTEYLKNSRCWIVWDKENGNSDFADCELAWTSFNSSVRMFKFRWNGMLQGNMKQKQERLHPTQKPEQLFEWILDKYSESNQLILDPFSGSGTTAIACHKLRRRFICIEKEPEYVRLSQKRLKIEQSQQVLF